MSVRWVPSFQMFRDQMDCIDTLSTFLIPSTGLSIPDGITNAAADGRS
jgi:hypothetical protein